MNGGRGRAVLALGLLVALAIPAEPQLVEPGICPFGTPQADWHEERFTADPWYEVKAFAVPGVHDCNPSPACTTWLFSPSEDGQGLHANLKFLSGQQENSVSAFAQYSRAEKAPRFNITFHLSSDGPVSMDVKLLATDYTDFALLWGCTEPNLFERKVASWVLSRQPILSQAAQEAVERLFRRHDIRGEKLVQTDHQVCPEPGSRAVDSASHQYIAPVGSEGMETPNSVYLGRMVNTQFLFLSVLIAFVAFTTILTVCFIIGLLRQESPKGPILPVRRQDSIIATLGRSSGSVDYTRFGGVGQGQVQTRKSNMANQPRLHA